MTAGVCGTSDGMLGEFSALFSADSLAEFSEELSVLFSALFSAKISGEASEDVGACGMGAECVGNVSECISDCRSQ